MGRRRKRSRRQYWYADSPSTYQTRQPNAQQNRKPKSYIYSVAEPEDIEKIAIEIFGSTVWSPQRS